MTLVISIFHHQFSSASEVTVQEVKQVSKTEMETFVDVTEKTCTKVIMKHSIGFAHHRKPL